jgi:alpha-tubulin suppressor-like RCC1 family protein
MATRDGVPEFVTQTQSQDGSQQSIGVTAQGFVYTWGRKYSLGQLGRPTSKSSPSKKPGLAVFDEQDDVRAVRVYAGGLADAGHSAVLDTQGFLWFTGCDRWQQLGLGSPSGGATGYTWIKGGRIYHNEFLRNDFVSGLLRDLAPKATIRDVALGGDHSVVLSSNQQDVITFGKGGEGQLGLSQKLFLSAAARSPALSSKTERIAAVCAIENCSLTLKESGETMNSAGKCRHTEQFMKALSSCRRRAEDSGLLRGSKTTTTPNI